MLRATLDANVIVSGLYSAGNPRRILDLAQSGTIELTVSQSILDEVSDVLQRDKFSWTMAEVKYALNPVIEVAEIVQPQGKVDLIKEDPDDNRILECAAAAKSDYLITGDKHLLKLGQYGQTKIVKPADFLAVLQERGR